MYCGHTGSTTAGVYIEIETTATVGLPVGVAWRRLPNTAFGAGCWYHWGVPVDVPPALIRHCRGEGAVNVDQQRIWRDNLAIRSYLCCSVALTKETTLQNVAHRRNHNCQSQSQIKLPTIPNVKSDLESVHNVRKRTMIGVYHIKYESRIVCILTDKNPGATDPSRRLANA